MPIYEYRCDDCEALYEVFQKMSDPPLEVCERCGGAVRKVLHPVAIHFKGSGFYTTDYGRGSTGRPAKETSDGASASDGGSGSAAASGSTGSSSAAAEGSSGKETKAKAPTSS